MQQLLWVAVAGIVGFVGNEIVAVFRIRVGREINSAALIADGYHARTDGFTSLAVVLGAIGVWFGFPLADPIIGLLITLAIFGIVWQSSKAVFTRMLDGVDPGAIDEIKHAAEHVPGVSSILDVRARWLGHRMLAELDIGVPGPITVTEADRIATELEHELLDHLPALKSARIRVRSSDSVVFGSNGEAQVAARPHAHGAPEMVKISGRIAAGELTIIDTAGGERMRFTPASPVLELSAEVVIFRGTELERLLMVKEVASAYFQSLVAPEEPHEFEAELRLRSSQGFEAIRFEMKEPHRH